MRRSLEVYANYDHDRQKYCCHYGKYHVFGTNLPDAIKLFLYRFYDALAEILRMKGRIIT